MEITRDESEKRELARGGECVYLGNPAPSDRDATVNLAPFQINDIRAGVAMRFDCRKLEQRVTLDFCALCHLFKPLLEASGPLIVAVTTSNRSVDTKDRTERALEQAVAAAGIDALTFVTQWDMSPPRRGPFGSFLTAMTDAMSRDPNACGYLYLQDDVELDERAIVWILAALEAKRRFLVASPYKPPTATPARTDPDLERVGAFVNRGYGTAGACSLLFNPAALRNLLSDRWVQRWRWRGEDSWRRIDQVVGAWASKWGGILYPHFSLAEHIGDVSSIYKFNREGTGHAAASAH